MLSGFALLSAFASLPGLTKLSVHTWQRQAVTKSLNSLFVLPFCPRVVRKGGLVGSVFFLLFVLLGRVILFSLHPRQPRTEALASTGHLPPRPEAFAHSTFGALTSRRPGEARTGQGSRGQARRAEPRPGEARRGEARPGEARRGQARRAEASHAAGKAARLAGSPPSSRPDGQAGRQPRSHRPSREVKCLTYILTTF